MTSKEKANELILKFTNLINFDFVTDLNWRNPNDKERNLRVKKDAKKIAIATSVEIKKTVEKNCNLIETSYWENVIKEIEKYER